MHNQSNTEKFSVVRVERRYKLNTTGVGLIKIENAQKTFICNRLSLWFLNVSILITGWPLVERCEYKGQ